MEIKTIRKEHQDCRVTSSRERACWIVFIQILEYSNLEDKMEGIRCPLTRKNVKY